MTTITKSATSITSYTYGTFELGPLALRCVLAEGTGWVTQRQMAALFELSNKTVSEHIAAIHADAECSPQATIRNFQTVRSEGNRSVKRSTPVYSTEMVLAVGYRTRSDRGVAFRQWVTATLTGATAPAQVAPDTALLSTFFKLVEMFSESQSDLKETQKCLKTTQEFLAISNAELRAALQRAARKGCAQLSKAQRLEKAAEREADLLRANLITAELEADVPPTNPTAVLREAFAAGDRKLTLVK
jgi:Virulence protein RhuM family